MQQLLIARSKQMQPAHVMDTSVAWSQYHDLYQVGLLLRDVDALTNLSPALVALRNLLLSKKFALKAVRGMMGSL